MAKINRYRITIATLLVFAIDCYTQDVVTGEAKTWEEAYWLANRYVAAREWFCLVPYLLLLADLPKKDLWDKLLITLFLLSSIITIWDYHNNANLRETALDYWVFLTLAAIIVALKITQYGWQTLWKSLR